MWRKKQFQPLSDTIWKDSLHVDETWFQKSPLQFFNIFDDELIKYITE